MNEIFIEGLKVVCCHGVNDFEKVEPQPFVFDARLSLDFSAAYACDDVEKTVSYAKVCKLITAVASENTYNLIETLAAECAMRILEGFPLLKAAHITVRKPEAPVNADFVSVGVTVGLSRERVYLSLGSNMGDREGYIKRALALLNGERGIEVKKVSSVIASAPYGGVAKGEFLNCVAEISCILPPAALLERIHEIEEKCGRVRAERWGDRTLDIDIVLFGDMNICEDDLIVPHPDFRSRPFVTEPLKEIAPFGVLLRAGIKE